MGLAGTGAAQRRGRGPVRGAGLADPADAGLGLRALLPAQRRVHHARVPGAALLPGGALVPGGHLHRRLRAHQDLASPSTPAASSSDAHGHRLLDRRPGGGGGHRDLHRVRRAAGGALHRHRCRCSCWWPARSPSPSSACSESAAGASCARPSAPASSTCGSRPPTRTSPGRASSSGAPILGVWYWCTDQFIVQRVLAARNVDHAPRRHHLRRLPEAAAALHLRDPGRDGLRAGPDGPAGAGPARPGAAHAGRRAAAGGSAGPGGGGAAGRAHELAVVASSTPARRWSPWTSTRSSARAPRNGGW